MLQYRTINQGTLELLNSLMEISELQEFYLVGGTALALQIGHRFSIDLDLFNHKDFDTDIIKNVLIETYSVQNIVQKNNALNVLIDFPAKSNQIIKLDLIKYNYPLLEPINIFDNKRLLSIVDIAAMKLSALANRGLKKDFYDIYYLLNSFSINKLIELYQQKYKVYNSFHLIKSLTYFEDADPEPDPITFEEISWNEIKSYMIELTKNIEFK
jgi:predicted nucleotidyltransferase component of viral defense system